jgi:hypothetical protein
MPFDRTTSNGSRLCLDLAHSQGHGMRITFVGVASHRDIHACSVWSIAHLLAPSKVRHTTDTGRHPRIDSGVVVECPVRVKWVGKYFDVIFGRHRLSYHVVVTGVLLLVSVHKHPHPSRFEVLMTLYTIFLLRGFPQGYHMLWDVTSSDSETVVVAQGSIEPGRSRVTVIDKKADLVLIHFPNGPRVHCGQVPPLTSTTMLVFCLHHKCSCRMIVQGVGEGIPQLERIHFPTAANGVTPD